MSKKLFWLLFVLILLLGFIIRFVPTQDNNFFFTTDQGYDAVYAREIWSRGQLLLRGPETGIPGVFAGPGWFYFISLGYGLFGGHPFGGVFLMILLSLVVTALLMWQVGKHVSLTTGLFVGVALQIFWPFYDTSRYTFNPFPLVVLAVFLILLLIRFVQGDKKSYFFAMIPVILAFNTEVAGAAALLLFYLTVGVWGVFNGKLSWKIFAVFTLVAPVIFLSQIGKDFLTVAQNSQGSNVGTFSGVSFKNTFFNFINILQSSILPQSAWASVIIFLVAVWGFLKEKKRNQFVSNFAILTLVLFAISYIFFATNKGWKDWHTLYLPTLLFVSFVLAALNLKRMGILITSAILVSQTVVFQERYKEYFYPSNDRSILANQLKVLDWVYQNRDGDGFNTYVYLADDDHDYPYQYLFWWYGRGKYGFVPCEYQNFPYPITSKHTYVPGSLFYNQPTLGCDKFTFLVIEPDKDTQVQEEWYEKVSVGTTLLEQMEVSGIRVEKRLQEKKD